jgi:hypothetical protein
VVRAVLGIASLLLSAATVLPGTEAAWHTFLLSMAGVAVLFAILAIVLTSLPPDHWANRSRTIRGILSVTALLATLMLAG